MLFTEEKIDENWIQDFLLEKKEIKSAGGQSPVKLIEYFEEDYWDRLTKEKQIQFAEATNKLLQSDLLNNYPPEKHIYLVNLIDMVCFIERKLPGKISSAKLLEWRKNGYPNIVGPGYAHPVIINEEIEKAFLLKEYYIHRFESKDSPFTTTCQSYADGTYKHIPYMKELWKIKKKLEPERVDRTIQTVNGLLEEDVPNYINDKQKWLANLLEYAYYIEKDMPGSIKKDSLFKWYDNNYFGVIVEQKFKSKLDELVGSLRLGEHS